MNIPDDLFRAAFFFIDIVGLSKSDLSTQTQAKKIKFLNKCIQESDTFNSKNSVEKITQSTGDGMLIVFKDGLEEPINLAKEFHQKLHIYNQNNEENDRIKVRIGCNIGNVFAIKDLNENISMWGPGVIIARRVLDLGESGHILISGNMAEKLKLLSSEYEKIIHPIHNFTIKHQESILLYSVYGENFGNSKPPELEMAKKIYHTNEIYELRKTVSFTKVEFELKLKKSHENLLEINRIYHPVNSTEESIYKLINGISTNVPKTMAELNVKIFDENKKELNIENIQVSSPLRKEFTIKLHEPLRRNQKNRHYNVIYEVEEPKPVFEHMFLVNSEKFTFTFTYPNNNDALKPKLFYISTEDREKKLISLSTTKSGMLTQMKWNLENSISEKDIIRLEW